MRRVKKTLAKHTTATKQNRRKKKLRSYQIQSVRKAMEICDTFRGAFNLKFRLLCFFGHFLTRSRQGTREICNFVRFVLWVFHTTGWFTGNWVLLNCHDNQTEWAIVNLNHTEF